MIYIFISYRRRSDAHPAARLRSELERLLSRDRIFMDVRNIPPGAVFDEKLREELSKCSALLAVIGPGWLDAAARRRLDDPDDWVRVEIATALKRNIQVVPVLLDDVSMPQPEILPDDLRPLARRNAFSVRHESFESDVESLLRKLADLLGGSSSRDPAAGVHPGSGKSFRDIDAGPEMVVVPAGEFWMGSLPDEPERWGDDEGPRHKVILPRPFAIGKYAVTFEEWDAAVADGLNMDRPAADRGWGRGRRPVINVSWIDAQAYAQWLSRKTGRTYRLPSEAEWEYAARAGTTTPFWWGKTITPRQANYKGEDIYAGGGEKGEFRRKTVPVDCFEPNPWGLHQVHGNVWEWTEDCWNGSYARAPTDGSAWMAGDCALRVLRGGSWSAGPRWLRSAVRSKGYLRFDIAGFRLARTL